MNGLSVYMLSKKYLIHFVLHLEYVKYVRY